MTATLAAWVHSLDPWIVQFTPTFGIRWYGVSYLLGFAMAYFVLLRLSKTGRSLIPAERLPDAMMWLVGGVLIGGRLGYVLFYQPSLFVQFDGSFPFWGVLAINQGGMASHGGIAGVIVASVRIARGWRAQDGSIVGRAPVLHVTDLVALVAPIGLFLGRIANFINGELLGRIVAGAGERAPWWSVRYPQELRGWNAPGVRVEGEHTPALTLAQQDELTGLVLKVRQPDDTYPRAIDRLIEHAGEFSAELARVVSARHPSQLYQAAAEGIAVGVALWLIWCKPRRPGVIGAWFLIVYGALRIVTEFYRLPDAHLIAPRIAGLSRGQWLSVAMIVAGMLLLVWRRTRPDEPLGGWRRAQSVAPDSSN